jgi:hypothetical protein
MFPIDVPRSMFPIEGGGYAERHEPPTDTQDRRRSIPFE